MPPLIRVSTVLQKLFPDSLARIPMDTLTTARDRGRYYHDLAKDFCLSLQFPDAHTFDPTHYPDDAHIVQALARWATAKHFTPLLIEERINHPYLLFCGTPDVMGVVGPEADDIVYRNKKLLIDWKFTADVLESNFIQVSAYWRLPLFEQADHALIVHINPYTGELTEHEVYRYGNGYWGQFCQGLESILNLE